MKFQTLYTSIGHFRFMSTRNGQHYPAIEVNQETYRVDIQELTVWSCLIWQFRDLDQVNNDYQSSIQQMDLPLPSIPTRPIEFCINRLLSRGLIVSGSGETEADALYDLLSGLYVVPVSESRFLRLLAFLKLWISRRIHFMEAKQFFAQNHPNEDERRVLALSRQALLSTAEIIKCVTDNVRDISNEDKLFSALYHDDVTTCYNIADFMRQSPERDNVLQAVANLYLHKQVVLQRVGLCRS